MRVFTVGGGAARGELPEEEAARVHVDAEERVAREVDRPLEHLGGHVAARAHLKRARRLETTNVWDDDNRYRWL